MKSKQWAESVVDRIYGVGVLRVVVSASERIVFRDGGEYAIHVSRLCLQSKVESQIVHPLRRRKCIRSTVPKTNHSQDTLHKRNQFLPFGQPSETSNYSPESHSTWKCKRNQNKSHSNLINIYKCEVENWNRFSSMHYLTEAMNESMESIQCGMIRLWREKAFFNVFGGLFLVSLTESDRSCGSERVMK